MRLWHESLIPYLNRQHLLGQHRELAALRGLGFFKKHSTVDYIQNHNPYKLFLYHKIVMDEMTSRGYKVSPEWQNPYYRGKRSVEWEKFELDFKIKPIGIIYPEHNEEYLQECIGLLITKGYNPEFYEVLELSCG